MSVNIVTSLTQQWTLLVQVDKFDIQCWQKKLHILFCSITPTNLGQFSKPGTDLKSACPDVLKIPLHVQFDQVLADTNLLFYYGIMVLEWYYVSLTSTISATTWSNCTCTGCVEIVRTSRFQICPRFWKLNKICGRNRAKQNMQLFLPVLYIAISYLWRRMEVCFPTPQEYCPTSPGPQLQHNVCLH